MNEQPTVADYVVHPLARDACSAASYGSPADSVVRNEDALAFEVELALRATGYPALRNLAVVVRDGVVSVCGRVPNYYMIQMASAAAMCVDGVHQVRLELDVTCAADPNH